MLGAIAAVALVVGTISATVSVSQDEQKNLVQDREPVVEVQAVETAE
jgi:hypothetical protein